MPQIYPISPNKPMTPLCRCSRTISMETGCQNIQLCVVILKVAFPPEVIGPMFLFPLIYITAQCSEAVLLALCYRCYQTVRQGAGGECHSCACFWKMGDSWCCIFGDLCPTSVFSCSDASTCNTLETNRKREGPCIDEGRDP